MIFKSRNYPNEMVAARRGSPLLIGVKTSKKLKVDFVDVDLDDSEPKGTSSLFVKRLMRRWILECSSSAHDASYAIEIVCAGGWHPTTD